jgi:ribosome-associated protein
VGRATGEVRQDGETPDVVPVKGPLSLGAFLKVAGVVASGGEAKRVIQTGRVRVNGTCETRRGHAVQPGDVVAVGNQRYAVTLSTDR